MNFSQSISICSRSRVLFRQAFRSAVAGQRLALLRFYSAAAAASSASTPEPYDVVVIGGGPAGLTLATALKNSPYTQSLKTLLVEGGSLEHIRGWGPGPDHYENRVSSLTPRSAAFLKRLGAWDGGHITQERVKPYDEMKVWDGLNDAARIDFSPDILGENFDIAYMIENFNLQHGLLSRLEELNAQSTSAPTKVLDKARVKSISRQEGENDWPVVELESGETFSARLLIGADGANSPARAFAQIEARGWDYNRHGLVASVKLEWEDFRAVAFQRFLKTGPIALLPLPDGFASLVWSCTPGMAAQLKALPPAAFCTMVNAGFRLGPVDIQYMLETGARRVQEGASAEAVSAELQDELEWRLQNVELVDEDNNIPINIAEVLPKSRASFPLKLKHADTYVAERVALVGDAAHTTHPLAGQGLNMGQQDVESLVGALERATRRGLDIGSLLAIEPYWSERYLANHLKLGVVDKLHKLYSFDFAPVVALRSWGLNLVNSLDMVKKELMKQASN